MPTRRYHNVPIADPWADPDDPDALVSQPRPLPRPRSVPRTAPRLTRDWIERLLIRATGSGWDATP